MPELLAACLLAIAAAAESGELAPQPDRPYRVVVALQFSDDPTFTPFFKGSVAREVRDQLSNFFGDLAQTQVVVEHPFLDKLLSTPLAELALSPAECGREKSDQVFLVLIDCDSGIYRLQWRRLSLEVQQIGPLQARTTPDRQWLAKAICLAVREDFAPVALIEPEARKDRVRLHFHGASFAVQGKARLAAWIEAGCVLQPLWVVRNRDGTLARMPIPFTVITSLPFSACITTLWPFMRPTT